MNNTPGEGTRMQWMKYCNKNNKEKDTHLKSLRNNYFYEKHLN